MKAKIKNSTLLYSGFFNLREDMLECANGVTCSYTSLLVGRDATVVLAQTKKGLWILNREYRYAPRRTLLGLPGGCLEKGEEVLSGAQRELFEETGYWSDDITLLGSCYASPGMCDQKIYYLFAKNAEKKGEQKLDPVESIEVELKTDEELQKEILTSDHIDGHVCIALWYKHLLNS